MSVLAAKGVYCAGETGDVAGGALHGNDASSTTAVDQRQCGPKGLTCCGQVLASDSYTDPFDEGSHSRFLKSIAGLA